MINSEREGKEIMAAPHPLFARDPGDEPMRIPRRSAPQPVEEEDIMIPPSDEDEEEEDEIMIPPSDEDEEEDAAAADDRSNREIIDLVSDDDDGISNEPKPVLLKNIPGRKKFLVIPGTLSEERSPRESPDVLAAHFSANGYIFVRDVLSAEMRADMHNMVTSEDMRETLRRKAMTTTKVVTGEEYAGGADLREFGAKYRGRMLNVLKDAPLLRLLESLLRGLSFDSTVRDWTLHFRALKFNAYTGVHSDWPPFNRMKTVDAANEGHIDPQRTRPHMTVWLPLTRCDPYSGGLLLSPKSHLKYIAPPNRSYPEAFNPRNEPWAGAEFNLGDVLIFEGRTVHGGPVNKAKGLPRFSLDFRLVPKQFRHPDYEK